MALSNAERQSKHRQRYRRLETEAAVFDVLEALVGPRIPDEMAGVAADAKSVSVKNRSDLPSAARVLLTSIVVTGVGDNPIGWRLYEHDAEMRLAVCVASAQLRAA